jgi:putative Mg2+ transporter-C (MgtC) family protein
MDFLDTLVGPAWAQREIVLSLVAAAVLGSVIGLEREQSGKPAGFRTHLLICVGAALLTQISIGVAGSTGETSGFRSDPGRIAAQIVSGIGFLGAGTIIQARGNVVGLTTAASMWVVAAIGMAVGANMYVAAVGTTALVIVALRLLARLEDRVKAHAPEERTLRVEVQQDPMLPGEVERVIAEAGARPRLTELRREENGYVVSYRTIATAAGRRAAIESLLGLSGVRSVTLI